jgi:hypothetical protein
MDYGIRIVTQHVEYWDITPDPEEYVPIYGALLIKAPHQLGTIAGVQQIPLQAPVRDVQLKCAITPRRGAITNFDRHFSPRVQILGEWERDVHGSWLSAFEVHVPTMLFATSETRELVVCVRVKIRGLYEEKMDRELIDETRTTVSLLSSGRVMRLSETESVKFVELDEDRISRAIAKRAYSNQDDAKLTVQRHQEVQVGGLTAEAEQRLHKWVASSSDEVF